MFRFKLTINPTVFTASTRYGVEKRLLLKRHVLLTATVACLVSLLSSSLELERAECEKKTASAHCT